MPPSRSASRPPGLLAAVLVTLVVFLGLAVSGIVLMIGGHRPLGTVLFVAGLLVQAVFHWRSRRRWAEHRGAAAERPQPAEAGARNFM